MASNQQSHAEQAPSSSYDPQQAELFAASAAEGALTDRKDPSLSEDLSQLSVSAEDHPSTESNAIDQSASPTSSQPSGSDAVEQPERVLSKEELVEEALNCPCISSMRDGPCGDSFIAAYKCFLESETEPKGMNCVEQFKGMQACMADHPEEYNLDDDDDDADPFAAQKPDSSQETPTSPTPASPTKIDSDPVPPSTASSS